VSPAPPESSSLVQATIPQTTTAAAAAASTKLAPICCDRRAAFDVGALLVAAEEAATPVPAAVTVDETFAEADPTAAEEVEVPLHMLTAGVVKSFTRTTSVH
jgi:hypothetical protein